MGDSAVLSHCSFLRDPWPKSTGVLEHYREGENKFGSPFFGPFPSDRISKETKKVNVHFFIHSSARSATPVNYTSEFQNTLKLIRIKMYYSPLIVHILTLCHSWGIYFIIGRTLLLPVYITVFKHRVTTVSISRPFLNLWPPRFCSIAGNVIINGR